MFQIFLTIKKNLLNRFMFFTSNNKLLLIQPFIRIVPNILPKILPLILITSPKSLILLTFLSNQRLLIPLVFLTVNRKVLIQLILFIIKIKNLLI